jgi:hypothetical protein
MFEEYQMAQLRHAIGGLAAGTVGTVVTVYTNPSPGYVHRGIGPRALRGPHATRVGHNFLSSVCQPYS